MALLQISEPGQSPEPHARRIAIGIDLGTTHSLVAAVRSGSVEVLKDEQGRVLLPSAVRYGEKGAIAIGDDALQASAQDPLNTIISVKRFMGRGRDDAQSLQSPYQLLGDADSGMVQIQTAAGPVSPVEVSAEILKVLRDRARAAFGLTESDELAGAVITVPAYFDDAQRQATKDAARLAGITVLRLINEPTAAALAYGLDSGAEGVYAIYDLGGGTFDISVLRLTKGVFEVVATGGDTLLGGDDFDQRLAERWLTQWDLPGGFEQLSAAEKRRLLRLARQQKESLTDQTSSITVISADWVSDAGQTYRAEIARDQFDRLTDDLVTKTFQVAQRVLHDAKVKSTELKGVVLVGGSTRMPCVRDAAERFFGSPPLASLDPDEVVAIGAASQADLLAGNKPDGDDWLLLDVLPLSLGLETMGGLTERIIPRNTPIPVSQAQEFTTFKDGQTAMAIHVVQGERELVSECRSLASFELRGFPPMVAGAARIQVTFQVDADGLLSVTAEEKSSGVKAAVTVKPSYGLTDGQIADMLKDAFSSAKEDMALRALREAQVDARRLLEATSTALSEDGDLLDHGERAQIDKAIDQLRTTCGGQDLDLLRARTKALSEMSDPFAARRMDRAVQRALAGQSITGVLKNAEH